MKYNTTTQYEQHKQYIIDLLEDERNLSYIIDKLGYGQVSELSKFVKKLGYVREKGIWVKENKEVSPFDKDNIYIQALLTNKRNLSYIIDKLGYGQVSELKKFIENLGYVKENGYWKREIKQPSRPLKLLEPLELLKPLELGGQIIKSNKVKEK